MLGKLAPGVFLVSSILLTGCALTQEFSRTPRTAVEQLLLTQAIEHAMHNLEVELPKETALHVDVTGLQTDRAHFNMVGEDRGILHGPSLDLLLIRDSVSTGLGRLGYRIDPLDADPVYLARVVVESFGTTQGLTFFGMPPVTSVLIPFSLPALILYSAEGQRGYARVHVDFFESRTGIFVGSTPSTIGRTRYHQYTVLFFFTWQVTDLTAPP
ncbi:MAG TPA: hypothetical protein VLA67_02830 [Nitrospiraceae bacterium]|nr:hypothetical protein [Nitrospiraceae bacterium]